MATTKIVTEVTLEQLDALVASNSLNEGLQYYVTDKEWLLTAVKNNLLKPISGSLYLLNELIPTFILADSIILDTGIISNDISIIPFELNVSANFRGESVEINNQLLLENPNPIIINQIGDFTFSFPEDMGSSKYYAKLNYSTGQFLNPEVNTIQYILCENVGNGQTIRLVFKFIASVFNYI